MENALIAAVSQYAELANYTEVEVLEMIKSGNESVTRSVQMLMFALA